MDPVLKRPVLHEPEAKIVSEVLAAHHGERRSVAGSWNVSQNTRDSRTRIILAHRHQYLTGKPRSDLKADPTLVIGKKQATVSLT